MGLPARVDPRPQVFTPPKVVLVTSNKGGTGKTTTAINLACAAVSRGYSVIALDLDKQANFAKWSSRRKKYAPNLEQVPVLEGTISDYERLMVHTAGYEIVFIDTPPGVHDGMNTLRDMIAHATYVLVPTQAGQFDLETTVPWLRQIREIKPRDSAAVLNRVNLRAADLHEIKHVITERAGRLCTHMIRDVTLIQRSMRTGHSVLDKVSDDKGKADYEDLWTWLQQEMCL